jgi:hypothetical protein
MNIIFKMILTYSAIYGGGSHSAIYGKGSLEYAPPFKTGIFA